MKDEIYRNRPEWIESVNSVRWLVPEPDPLITHYQSNLSGLISVEKVFRPINDWNDWNVSNGLNARDSAFI